MVFILPLYTKFETNARGREHFSEQQGTNPMNNGRWEDKKFKGNAVCLKK
jgi:hypothetical protein